MQKRFFILLTLLFIISVNSFTRSLEEIRRSGKIYIGFTSYDYNTINYPLAKDFARYLNVEMVEVEIEWEEAFTKNGQLPDDIESNPTIDYTPDVFSKVDLIASTFTILDWRKKLMDFAQTLYSAELLVVDKSAEMPEDFDDLKKKRIAFLQETSFEQHLNEINTQVGGGILLQPQSTSEEVFQQFLQNKVFGIVLDADEALNFKNKHKNARIAFPISDVKKSGWAVEKNNRLKYEVESFFETIANNGVLDDVFFHFFNETYSVFVNKIGKSAKQTKYIRDLDEILKSKKLVVAFRERDFVFHESGKKQFMHALAEEFANYLGVEMDYVVTPDIDQYWKTAQGNIAKDSVYTPEWFNYYDLACDAFAPLDWRKTKVDFVSVYPSEYYIVALKETKIEKLGDLQKMKGITVKGSTYEEILIRNNITNYEYSPTYGFIDDVIAGKADYALIFDAYFEVSNHPELEAKLPMGGVDVSWGLRQNQPLLKAELNAFIAKSKETGLINILLKALNANSSQSTEDFITSYYSGFQTGQLPYVSYGAEDGLPQEDVFTIFQDRKGYMWFGTNSGAVKYNGREMEVFDMSDGLHDNTVFDIVQDESGKLFFATSRGVAVFENDSVKEILYPGKAFRSVFIDKKNNKWFYGNEGIIIISASGVAKNFSREHSKLPQIIYDIIDDKSGQHIFLATNEGIFYFSEEGDISYKITQEGCFSIHLDNNGNVWFSTKEGVFITDILSLKKRNYSSFSKFNNQFQLNSALVTAIEQNKYGTVWLVSDSRIVQVISTDQQAVVYESKVGLKNNTILSFFEDKEDNIWIGFSGGLQRLTKRSGLRNFHPGSINSYIYSMFEDKAGRIWFSSNNGVYFFKNELTNFSAVLKLPEEKYAGAILPNQNIILAGTRQIIELDVNTLAIVSQRQFKDMLVGIESVFVDSKGSIYLLTGNKSAVYKLDHFYSSLQSIENKLSSNIFQLCEHQGMLLAGNKSGIVQIKGSKIELYKEINCAVWSLCSNDEKLWLGTECGLQIVENNQLKKLGVSSNISSLVVKSILPAKNKNYLWLGTNSGLYYFNKEDFSDEFSINSKDGLLGDEITVNGLFIDNQDLLWIGSYHGVSNFSLRAKAKRNYAPLCYIEKVFLNGFEINVREKNVFKHYENSFVFEISGLSFTDEKSIEYEFYLRGVGNDYSSYNKGPEYKAYFSNLPSGKYEFIYKAKGKNNIWGYAQKYEFTVLKAWYSTWFFRIFVVFVICLSAFVFYRLRIRSIKQMNNMLEAQVKERTKELEAANNEISQQRDMATSQRDTIIQQKKEITDSIYYAERIQRSLLPDKKLISQTIPDSFVLYKPRDIVSGDFYWAAKKNGKFVVTVADCTGHGVPGAFMSMLGIAFLNDVIGDLPDFTAAQILEILRSEVIAALQQKGIEGEAKDGMDMSLIVMDLENGKIEFAGANNHLYLIRNQQLIQYNADKMPVAIHYKMPKFTNHVIDVKKGDALYMYTDGYADQFGGPDGKKFLAKRFRELLMLIHNKPMDEQKKILSDQIEDWRMAAKAGQVDDILVMGLRIP